MTNRRCELADACSVLSDLSPRDHQLDTGPGQVLEGAGRIASDDPLWVETRLMNAMHVAINQVFYGGDGAFGKPVIERKERLS